MRLSGLFIGAFATAASALCTSGCTVGACIRAIAEAPAGGEAFCSSWLSQTPATTVIVEFETATSTRTIVETASTVLTLTTGTVTNAAPTVTIYERAEEPGTEPGSDNSASNILAQCSNLPARVSSACSCVLSTTSTVTVHETSTAIVSPEYTTTTVETLTSGIVATETATPTRIIPAQPVVNGDFESGATNPRNISPWINSTATTGGRIEFVSGVNPCTAALYCAGGSNVIRVYPPTSGAYPYISISQEFYAQPSTTYSFSFLYRCLNNNQENVPTGIVGYYKGLVMGRALCPVGSPGGFIQAEGMVFTTDASGYGEIRIDFQNLGLQPYLYIYADAFRATAV